LASTVASMTASNRAASRAAVEAGIHAATDITGFGLAGHAHEMAERSGVAVRISMGAVPLLPGARAHAAGSSFGGLERNQAFFLSEDRVRFDGLDDQVLRTLALDPQTSGGLLLGVPEAHAQAWDEARKKHGVDARRIGAVTNGAGVTLST
ncbi:MAG TPA: AIR synthase-related protein, partial [Candidatus Limnocylindria bacterium]|nr:AIR synthase-related protein [Candidatus Limnocylindria bacterium]